MLEQGKISWLFKGLYKILLLLKKETIK